MPKKTCKVNIFGIFNPMLFRCQVLMRIDNTYLIYNQSNPFFITGFWRIDNLNLCQGFNCQKIKNKTKAHLDMNLTF